MANGGSAVKPSPVTVNSAESAASTFAGLTVMVWSCAAALPIEPKTTAITTAAVASKRFMRFPLGSTQAPCERTSTETGAPRTTTGRPHLVHYLQ